MFSVGFVTINYLWQQQETEGGSATTNREVRLNWSDVQLSTALKSKDENSGNDENDEKHINIENQSKTIRFRAESNMSLSGDGEINNRLNNGVFSIKFLYLTNVYQAYSNLIEEYTKQDKNDLTPLWLISSSLYQQFISPNATEQV